MRKRSALEIYMTEFVPQGEVAAIEAQVAKVQEPTPTKWLEELQTPAYGRDPNELIKHRFLYRGAVCLLCGPTGVGKSSLLMQLAIYLAVGRTLFGVVPGDVYQTQGMRILLVQAENDDGDLAEMRDGVLAGCGDLNPEEKRAAQKRIRVATICDKSGEAFTTQLDALLTELGPFELVMVDPAFAYLGGDSNSQKDVSHFMRELINPLLQKHQVGMILAHHTNKPLRGKEKDNWQASDFSYLGAGSAEWINPSRAALALRSVGSETVFEFRAAKRGRRLRWEDADGKRTTHQHIAHHTEAGVICWRLAEAAEVAEVENNGKGGRPRKCDHLEVLHCIELQDKRNQAYYMRVVSKAMGCSERAVQEAIRECVKAGMVRFNEDGREKVYSVTEKGRKACAGSPSCVDWNEHTTETPA